jgi:hypothetical protein
LGAERIRNGGGWFLCITDLALESAVDETLEIADKNLLVLMGRKRLI